MLLLAGFLSGIVNSIAAGGALIAFPAMLIAGLSPLSAAITGYLMVWVGQVSALAASFDDAKAIPVKYLKLLIPCLVGAVIGISLLSSTSTETFNQIVPWLLFFTVAVFILQPYLQKHIHRPTHLRPRISEVAVWLAVLTVSIYGGYFGIGAGLMLLALFGFSKIKSIYQMIALKNMAGFIITLAATVVFALQDKIVWKYGIVLAIGSIAGGYLGAKVARKVSPSTVHWLVSGVGAVVVTIAFLEF